MKKPTPTPNVVPVDGEKWMQELHLSNFTNAYYQYRDLQALEGVGKVLEIGPGQGFSTLVLKAKGYSVTTFDIDEMFHPDYVGSVHDMKMIKDGQFDVVIASHVLEHLPEHLLDQSLEEVARVSKYAIVYLPIAGTHHLQLRFLPGFHGFDFTLSLDIFNYFERPTGAEPRYCQGQHYWEIGYRGFKVKNLIARFSPHFKVLKHYRNREWNPSYNFVLESKS